jgi:hypothetical protein
MGEPILAELLDIDFRQSLIGLLLVSFCSSTRHKQQRSEDYSKFTPHIVLIFLH